MHHAQGRYHVGHPGEIRGPCTVHLRNDAFDQTFLFRGPQENHLRLFPFSQKIG
jgi:hypothetical protein